MCTKTSSKKSCLDIKSAIKKYISDYDKIKDDLAMFAAAWMIFETFVFDTEAKIEKVKGDKVVSEDILEKLEYQNTFGDLKNRWREKEKNAWLENLFHKKNATEKKHCQKTFKNDEPKPIDQVETIIYIAFRFRNNLFHGNKIGSGTNSKVSLKKQRILFESLSDFLIRFTQTFENQKNILKNKV